MIQTHKDSYDAVIIGAGMGGLVCGCYLAKAGIKVLIAEQHFKPGGYCTSFKRQGFTFDAAAHSFGGYRKDGIVRKVFNDLGIDKKVNITRYDPSDIIITPDYNVTFYADLDKTINDFQSVFPDERDGIRDFFNFIINPDQKFFMRVRNWTFQNLLDNYFKNDKLKSIISFPLLGNGALPPSLMSALIGAKIFQEFLVDGGYYPEGGMQALPDALAEKFKEFGGDLRLSCSVKKIRIKDNMVTGTVMEKNGFIPSKYVISNCDSRQTFLSLIGRSKISNKDFLDTMNNMIPSRSIFILYLGLNNLCTEEVKSGTNIWLLSNYNLDNTYLLQHELNLDNACTMVRFMPNQKALLAFVNVPFRNKKYWDVNKEKVLESFIKRIEEKVFPELTQHIKYKGAATPFTLYKYTLNYKGAAYGWACMPSQLGLPDLRKPSFIQGLYLTGHWTTQGIGIPGVIYSGHDTAKLILRKEQRHTQSVLN
ncbi:MAG TPA: NAD(P)/FAD-dependent oxidoreductase [Nitrospirota bacterium]|nr:NAD(P)/FAD-dependent oxidoreductase [Nitrospirota bacterium]